MAFPSDHGDPDPRARREMRAPAPSNEKTMIIEAWEKNGKKDVHGRFWFSGRRGANAIGSRERHQSAGQPYPEGKWGRYL